MDQLVPLLRKALKLSKPHSTKPTIGGGLHRVTVYRRRHKCGPMTDIWMENCGIATNESDPARIVAAAVDPKVIKAAALLVAPARVRSEASVRREHIRAMRGYLSEKRLDPLFSYRQAVERAKSGISTRNMADMRRMNKDALGTDLDRFHSLANEKLNTTSRHDLFKICRDRLGIKNTEGSVSVDARCSIEINILRYAQNHSTEDPCADAATVLRGALQRLQYRPDPP